MSLLRIRGSLTDTPLECEWALLDGTRKPVLGHGRLTELPRHAGQVQFLIPASQVLFAGVQLPQGVRRRAGSVLAFAIEDATLGEPDTQEVSWLGSSKGADVLAVIDRQSLHRWLAALEEAGFGGCEVHCETLLLPWTAGEWSLAWDGREGYLRTGQIEGAATDCGDRSSPPLSLRLALEAAAAGDGQPTSITIHTTAPNAAPDMDVWQRELGIPLRAGGAWDWRSAVAPAGVSLMQTRRRWRALSGAIARLRPAAWIMASALGIHALALSGEWARLAVEQQTLQRQMESRFRAAFPDAVAVVDPALQMRRKLAEARHLAGAPDSGDFLPLISKVATAIQELPAGSLRIATYENGRLSLHMTATEPAAIRRAVARLTQSGLSVDMPAAPARPDAGVMIISVGAL